jgi:hypothetical protein
LLKDALKALGKSLLIVTGVSYGVVRALDMFRPGFAHTPQSDAAPVPEPSPEKSAQPENLAIQRLDRLEHDLQERLTRIESSLESLSAASERTSPDSSARGVEGFVTSNVEGFVTRAELNAALEQFSGDLNSDIERRFDVQNRSVQSLRTMIAHTDELLEQVLESIESASVSA